MEKASVFFLKPHLSALVCNGFWTQLQIKFANYLRAKEKWAEALGEKFLGLSCGLVPAKEDTEMKFERGCSRRRTNVRMIQAIRARLFYRDKKLKRAKHNLSGVKLYLNKKIRKIYLNGLDVFLHHLQCVKWLSPHRPWKHSSLSHANTYHLCSLHLKQQ